MGKLLDFAKRTNWKNESEGAPFTPVTKTDLARYEDGIADATSRVNLLDRVPLKTLFQPFNPTDVYPAADVMVDKYSTDHVADGGFDGNAQGILWNDTKQQNTQGMNLVPNNPNAIQAGCMNLPTPRALGACVDFEWEITGDRFAVMTAMTGGSHYDSQVYVSDETGKMRRLRARPLVFAGTTDTVGFRVVRFNSFRTRRVRFIGGANAAYYQLLVMNSATVRKTADRPLALSISDSFREGSGMYVAGTAESYSTAAITDRIIERTGFAYARFGQGGTGIQNNGSGQAIDGPAGGIPGNPVPFFYDATIDKIKAIGKNKIRLVDINGTINDGDLFTSKQQVKDRLNLGLNKISSWDSGIRFVLWAPEPYNFGSPGDPANLTNVNVAQTRAAYFEVMAERPNKDIIGVVDANNPETPFYWGNGHEGALGNGTPQAYRTSTDTIHYNYIGGQAYADQGVDAMGEFLIDATREIVA